MWLHLNTPGFSECVLYLGSTLLLCPGGSHHSLTSGLVGHLLAPFYHCLLSSKTRGRTMQGGPFISTKFLSLLFWWLKNDIFFSFHFYFFIVSKVEYHNLSTIYNSFRWMAFVICFIYFVFFLLDGRSFLYIKEASPMWCELQALFSIFHFFMVLFFEICSFI